ncbi:hypothetical protein MAHJHV28_46900 [Mycobacterium avium subsp. hominissuis]
MRLRAGRVAERRHALDDLDRLQHAAGVGEFTGYHAGEFTDTRSMLKSIQVIQGASRNAATPWMTWIDFSMLRVSVNSPA